MICLDFLTDFKLSPTRHYFKLYAFLTTKKKSNLLPIPCYGELEQKKATITDLNSAS
jgi:hypothetical protein